MQKKLSDQVDDIEPKMVATIIFGAFDLDRSQKLSKKQFFEGYLCIFILYFDL